MISGLNTRWVAGVLVVAAALGAARSVGAVEIDFDRYAAVAYSRETGKYGYAWNYGSKATAEREALSMCPAADAKIVGWVKGGWLVLAIGDNDAYGVGWEYGDGATNRDAADRAIKQCKQRADRVKTLVVVCSGDYRPQIIK